MTTHVSASVPEELLAEMDRLVREGWYRDRSEVILQALERFMDGKSLLGDSPRLLIKFAADALNESRPETALKFVDRGMTLLSAHEHPDLSLYRALVELRVQTLLVLDREGDALSALEEARLKLPNNPGVTRWLDQLAAKGIS
ncbi:MAG: ribbon-helix-helix domain-containing protein [Acidobacteriota bacterium]